MKETNYYSLSEAAKVLSIHPNTLKRWVDKGHIKCFRTAEKHRLFRKDMVDSYYQILETEQRQRSRNYLSAKSRHIETNEAFSDPDLYGDPVYNKAITTDSISIERESLLEKEIREMKEYTGKSSE